MILTRAIWLLVGLNVVLFVFAVWAARQEDKVADEIEQLRQQLAERETALIEAIVENDSLSGEYQNARAELDAVDATLGDFYCPVLDPETDEPRGSFYQDHGVHLAMDKMERLKDELEQLWGESEAHASGDTCLSCERLATAGGFPWCDQCFLEEQGKYLALMAEMWKAKTDRLQAEAEGLRRWLAEEETDLTEANAENARLAGEYQSAADEVCAALGVEWTPENRYPTVAVEAIGRLQARSKLVTLELAELLMILANAVDSTKSLGFAQLTYIARSTATRIRELIKETNDAN